MYLGLIQIANTHREQRYRAEQDQRGTGVLSHLLHWLGRVLHGRLARMSFGESPDKRN